MTPSTKIKIRALWVHAFASSADSRHGGRHERLKSDLSDHGIDVTIVACRKNHLNPTLSLSKTDMRANDRIWLPGFSSSLNNFARLINVLTFFIGLQTLRFKTMERVDFVVGSTPDPVAAWGAYLLSKRLGVPFALEVRDVWPETLIKVQSYRPWHPYILILAALERRLFARARVIISNLPNLESYVRSFGTKVPVLHAPNYIAKEDIISEIPASSRKPLRVIYAGSMGMANDLETFLKAVEEIERKDLTAVLRVDIFGDGPLERQYEKKYAKLSSVTFHKRVSRVKVLNEMRKAHVGIICWRNIDLYRHGISANKLPDYLSSGLPVIIGYGYEHVIGTEGAGLLIRPENVDAMEKAIRTFIDLDDDAYQDMRSAAVRLAREKYCFDGFSELMVLHLKQLANLSNGSKTNKR